MITQYWPDLAFVLHISPADIRRMTYRDLRAGLMWLESYIEERKRAR